MTVFPQARRRLSEDSQATPLCCRLFCKEDSTNAKVPQAGKGTLKGWKDYSLWNHTICACQRERETETEKNPRSVGDFCPQPCPAAKCDMGDLNLVCSVGLSSLMPFA